MSKRKPGETHEMLFVSALAVVGLIQVGYLGLKKVIRAIIPG
jgi:hypothetical protein